MSVVDRLDVARHLLATEEWKHRNEPRAFASIRGDYDQQSWEELEPLLARLVRPDLHQINRAAEALVSPERRDWAMRDVASDELFILPPSDSRQLRELAAPRPRGMVSVRAVANLVNTTPWGKLDPHARRYVPCSPRRDFPETLIVREEFSEDTAFWRIGDGYHRAVVLHLEGRSRIRVLAGSRAR